jgi:hypothetical protein
MGHPVMSKKTHYVLQLPVLPVKSGYALLFRITGRNSGTNR